MDKPHGRTKTGEKRSGRQIGEGFTQHEARLAAEWDSVLSVTRTFVSSAMTSGTERSGFMYRANRKGCSADFDVACMQTALKRPRICVSTPASIRPLA